MAEDTRTVTVLHISDTQFGRNHLFRWSQHETLEARYDTLYTRLTDDLKKLQQDPGLAPDLVLITGDLVENGRPTEYKEFLRFVDGLESFLRLGHDRVVIIPGNHDINRDECEAYFKKCSARDEEPKPPYWPKWEHFVAGAFGPFYKDCPQLEFTPDQPWTLFEMPDLRVVVAGLNSTMAESHREQDHHGHLGEEQLRWFGERLGEYKANGWLRFAALHHNIREVRSGQLPPEESLRDVKLLYKYLEGTVNAFFHGHTHDGTRDRTPLAGVPILSAGSAAVVADARPPEVPNQYQIVRFWRDRFQRWCRAYYPDGQLWGGDNRAAPSRDRWWDESKYDFGDAHGALGRPAAGARTPTTPPRALPEIPEVSDDGGRESGSPLVRGFSSGHHDIRVWPSLETPSGERWLFRVGREGLPVREQELSTPTDPQERAFADSGASACLSPDGSALATMVAGRLFVSMVNPSRANVHSWAGPLDVPYQHPRVAAVARKGNRAVWCAIADDHRWRWAALSRSTKQPEWCEVGVRTDGSKANAVIVGSRLLFLADGEILEAHLPDGRAKVWRPRDWNWEQQKIIAIDAAEVGGRSFVAMLAQSLDSKERVGDERFASRMVIVMIGENEKAVAFELKSPTKYLSLVRAPHSDAIVCILESDGQTIERKVIRPLGSSTSVSRSTADGPAKVNLK